MLVTAVLRAPLAIGVAITGFFRPTLIPLCFAPEESGIVTVVCPTPQSEPFVPTGQPADNPAYQVRDIDDVIEATAKRPDLIVVELVGLTATAIATAAAIRRIKGSAERYGLPVPSPPSSSRLARSPPSWACCSCAANSSRASARWTRPRKSLPGRWSSGTRNSCSPALSISKARPYSIMSAVRTGLSPLQVRHETITIFGLCREVVSRNPTGELRITRVFSCVARGFKARPSFMFAGCCWPRSLAIDGSSGTSRGHGS